MATEQAGTPEAATDGSVVDAGTPSAGTQDGSGLNAQQQKDFMAMKVNLENERNIRRQREQEIERLSALAYGRGAQAATDPDAETYQGLSAIADSDVAANGAKRAWDEARAARFESQLSTDLHAVPRDKVAKVAFLVRSTGYKATVEQALASLEDPDAVAAQAEIARLKAENERLKKQGAPQEAQRNPAAAIPAEASALHTGATDMAWSEIRATYARGGAAAKELRDKMDAGQIRPDHSR